MAESKSPLTVADLESILDAENHDIIILTDGSGTYDSGVMASACWVYSKRFKFSEYAVTGATCGNTIRSELSGILLGLRCFSERLVLPEPVLRKMKIRVIVLCDNAAVDLGVNNPDKQTVEKDLWASYGYYSGIYSISAKHIPREIGGRHSVIDAMASNFRALLKEFFTNTHKP